VTRQPLIGDALFDAGDNAEDFLGVSHSCHHGQSPFLTLTCFAYLHMDKYMPDTSATGLNCESAAFKVPLLSATINLITNATSI